MNATAHGFWSRHRAQPRRSEEAAPASLLEFLAEPHSQIQRALGFAPEAAASTAAKMDRYDAEDVYDAEVAALSAHLGAVEAVVHPAARHHLAGGHRIVAYQRRRARRLERLMRLIEGSLYGDVHAADMDVGRLQRDLRHQIEAYVESERDLARRLDDAMTLPQRRELVHHLAAAMTHAPTRPHPYIPHPRGLAGLVLRACSLWDRVLDVMDNRKVPGVPARRRSNPLSRWDRYVVGVPRYGAPMRSVGGTPPSPASPTTRPDGPGRARD